MSMMTALKFRTRDGALRYAKFVRHVHGSAWIVYRLRRENGRTKFEPEFEIEALQ